MFGLRVPIISVVIGEGGSGGALAIGCANRNLIMENSVYYVASPTGTVRCALCAVCRALGGALGCAVCCALGRVFGGWGS